MALDLAGVVELVDTLDLGFSGFGRGGSSPFARTRSKEFAVVVEW